MSEAVGDVKPKAARQKRKRPEADGEAEAEPMEINAKMLEKLHEFYDVVPNTGNKQWKCRICADRNEEVITTLQKPDVVWNNSGAGRHIKDCHKDDTKGSVGKHEGTSEVRRRLADEARFLLRAICRIQQAKAVLECAGRPEDIRPPQCWCLQEPQRVDDFFEHLNNSQYRLNIPEVKDRKSMNNNVVGDASNNETSATSSLLSQLLTDWTDKW